MRRRWFFVLAALVLAAVVTGISVVEQAEVPARTSRSIRSLDPVRRESGPQISSTMPMPSAHPRRLSAMLEQGPMPPRATTGEVLSDTQCAPRTRTRSPTARNEVRLAGGSTIIGRHPHEVAHVAEGGPSDTVRLLPLDTLIFAPSRGLPFAPTYGALPGADEGGAMNRVSEILGDKGSDVSRSRRTLRCSRP